MYCRNCAHQLADQAEFCTSCGQRPLAGARFCANCGAESAPGAEVCIKCGVRLGTAPVGAVPAAGGAPEKDWLVALLLSILVGSLGVDRFYLGYVGLGILKLVTAGGCGIWWIIDVVLIATQKMTDAQGRPLRQK
ncbi:MAG TPA: TM2 domain-containing protein [Terriglobia bacterium]|nr:TM2 domain-containing protein [Terriglobia bacterium]